MKNLSIIFYFLFATVVHSIAQSNAVNERTFIALGGEKQYVEMTGSSDKNPVLLFLHGGPGWPQTPYLRFFNNDLTKHFIMVSWDQAGCGLSYMKDPDPKNLSLDILVNDAHELTKMLKKKFDQRKIYLAGFSWGSIIGLKLAAMYPEDYKAYFGISQAISLKKTIPISRQWIKKTAEEHHDLLTLRTLDSLNRNDTNLCKRPVDCFIKQYELLTKYHGAIYNPETEKEIDSMFTVYPDYKNYDWNAGFFYSAYRLEYDMFHPRLDSIKSISIPVYFFLGRHDWNLPPAVSVAFLKKLHCPKKGIVWFEKSGHEPLEEEAGLFNKMIVEKAEEAVE